MMDESNIKYFLVPPGPEMVWLANIDYPSENPQVNAWMEGIWSSFGRKNVHVGPPAASAGQPARYWFDRGLVGVYVKYGSVGPKTTPVFPMEDFQPSDLADIVADPEEPSMEEVG